MTAIEIRKALLNKKYKEVEILEGVKAKVKLLSLAELDSIKLYKDDVDKNVELISSLYFDIETGEKLFTAQFLKDEVANTVLIDLYLAAIRANGGSDKDAEKN